ncbi:hypothetical protein HK101_008443 [Irineochytrium annulatum]|nr:hypothetical protein HK101_008443 [Irineochytrium annulatum]
MDQLVVYENGECAALLQLYFSTNGPNWTNNQGWTASLAAPGNCCQNFGVLCDAFGNVIVLNLEGNNLAGQLPDVFAALPNLFLFAAGFNNLSGAIPPSLTSLLGPGSFLDLQSNSLAGSIPAFTIDVNLGGQCFLSGNPGIACLESANSPCVFDFALPMCGGAADNLVAPEPVAYPVPALPDGALASGITAPDPMATDAAFVPYVAPDPTASDAAFVAPDPAASDAAFVPYVTPDVAAPDAAFVPDDTVPDAVPDAVASDAAAFAPPAPVYGVPYDPVPAPSPYAYTPIPPPAPVPYAYTAVPPAAANPAPVATPYAYTPIPPNYVEAAAVVPPADPAVAAHLAMLGPAVASPVIAIADTAPAAATITPSASHNASFVLPLALAGGLLVLAALVPAAVIVSRRSRKGAYGDIKHRPGQNGRGGWFGSRTIAVHPEKSKPKMEQAPRGLGPVAFEAPTSNVRRLNVDGAHPGMPGFRAAGDDLPAFAAQLRSSKRDSASSSTSTLSSDDGGWTNAPGGEPHRRLELRDPVVVVGHRESEDGSTRDLEEAGCSSAHPVGAIAPAAEGFWGRLMGFRSSSSAAPVPTEIVADDVRVAGAPAGANDAEEGVVVTVDDATVRGLYSHQGRAQGVVEGVDVRKWSGGSGVANGSRTGFVNPNLGRKGKKGRHPTVV